MELIVNENDSVRLDKYISQSMNITRSQVKKMIDNNKVMVNNQIQDNSYVVKVNDSITVDESKENSDIKKIQMNIDIIYEDEDIIVINKPSGLVVHPACGHQNDTLVNGLMYHTTLSDNNEERPGIVHRIDADTSGLLIVAKNNEAHNILAESIKNKQVVRKYLALVHQIIAEDTATIDAPIGRDPHNRKMMCVINGGKEAITHVKVLERYTTSTLVECILDTGRTHQIRVHMKYINHPVVNDKVYGYRNMDDSDFGQMLHAYSLTFDHPRTKKKMEFTVDPPRKFQEILVKYQNI